LETDATRTRALLVGLPDVNVIGIGDWPNWVRVVIETPATGPAAGAVASCIDMGSARSSSSILRCSGG